MAVISWKSEVFVPFQYPNIFQIAAPKVHPFSQPRATPWEGGREPKTVSAQRANRSPLGTVGPSGREINRVATRSQGVALGWENPRAFGPNKDSILPLSMPTISLCCLPLPVKTGVVM